MSERCNKLYICMNITLTIPLFMISCLLELVSYVKTCTTDYKGCCYLWCYVEKGGGANICKWCTVGGLVVTLLLLLTNILLIALYSNDHVVTMLVSVVTIPFLIYVISLWVHTIYACINRRCHGSFKCFSFVIKAIDSYKCCYGNDPYNYRCFIKCLSWICCPYALWFRLCCYIESQQGDIEKGFKQSKTTFVGFSCTKAPQRERTIIRRLVEDTWQDTNVGEGQDAKGLDHSGITIRKKY